MNGFGWMRGRSVSWRVSRCGVAGWLAGVGLVVFSGGLVPSGALGAVTSVTAGTGISLSPSPCTSTCTVQLATGWALSNPLSAPLFTLTNTGTGDALDVTGPVGIRATVNGTGKYAVLAHGGNTGAGVIAYGGPSTGVGLEGVGSGSSHGVVGYGGTTGGVGTVGQGRATNAYGLAGYGTGTDSGVYGQGGTNGGDGGRFSSTSAGASAVFGSDSASSGGSGGSFQSTHGIGVYGATRANGEWGVAGSDLSPAGGLAGYFSSVNGTGVFAGGGGANPAIHAEGGANAGDGVDATAGSSSTAVGGNGISATGGDSGPCAPAMFCDGYAGGNNGGNGVVGTGGQGGPVDENDTWGMGGAGVKGVGGTSRGSGLFGAGPGLLAVGGQAIGEEIGGVGVEAYPGDGPGGVGEAGEFQGGVVVEGNLDVNGTITGGTKDFKIDDPRDPANKYLVHTSVESPDAENVYNGNITTDANGYATVGLPAYFDAENINPRYQLTVIGALAQAVVWHQESHNRFTIRTNHGHVKVSWQITGIRNDPYARSVRASAEQAKPAADRGRYLYPAGYRQPASAAIGRIPRPTVAKLPRIAQPGPRAAPGQAALPPAPTAPSSP